VYVIRRREMFEEKHIHSVPRPLNSRLQNNALARKDITQEITS